MPKKGADTLTNTPQAELNRPDIALNQRYTLLGNKAHAHRVWASSSAGDVPLPSTDGTCWATNTAERPPPHAQPTLSPPPCNQSSVIHRPAPLRYDRHTDDGRPWSASPRLFGRDASLCRSLRHVMCVRRHRSTPDSPEYSNYASLHDCYRYVMERGSETLPSDAPNRADEWSFFLCCVVDRFFLVSSVSPAGHW